MSDTTIEQDKLLYLRRMEQEAEINPSEDLPYPPSAISAGKKTFRGKEYDIPICTYGNFAFIHSQPKSKKTFFVSLLASAYLTGFNSHTGPLKGHPDGMLVHVDTEQGKFHAQKTFQRPTRMGNVKADYRSFALRAYSPENRRDFIELFLDENDVGLLIIDGMADLVNDVNDLDACNKAVGDLMRWSEEYNLSIITVIHSNFGSTKATGHLGSALSKKCETEIIIEPQEGGSVLAKCKASRNFSFEDMYFEVTDDGLPKVIDNNHNPF